MSMIRRRILLHHPVELPARNYGGVERVVLWLARGLVERGHQVWVAARTGSRMPRGVGLVEIEPEQSSAMDLLPKLPRGVELVHFMAPPGSDAIERLELQAGCRSVLTVHGNGKPGEEFPLNTVFLSRDHAARHGAQAFVYNGIDPAELQFALRKESWYLFLSKTTWSVKNLRGAIRLCARAHVGLRVAGGSGPWCARLEVALRPSMRWMGSVGTNVKAELLARAKALVFPITWPEPFGLVVAEALMSGTPVLASRKGSLLELVPSDVGMLLDAPVDASDRNEAWVEWLSRDRLPWNPERCRAWAMEMFHYSKMAASYEAIYEAVLGGSSLNAREPCSIGDWRTHS